MPRSRVRRPKVSEISPPIPDPEITLATAAHRPWRRAREEGCRWQHLPSHVPSRPRTKYSDPSAQPRPSPPSLAEVDQVDPQALRLPPPSRRKPSRKRYAGIVAEQRPGSREATGGCARIESGRTSQVLPARRMTVDGRPERNEPDIAKGPGPPLPAGERARAKRPGPRCGMLVGRRADSAGSGDAEFSGRPT